jgi:glycogen synthase
MVKVLMLGWEFPPFFSGGLGVATHGIVKALSPKVDIRLILPTATINEAVDNVRIIGLNRVTAAEINLERLQFNYSFLERKVHHVPVFVSPYHANEITFSAEQKLTDDFELLMAGINSMEIIHSIFTGKDIYGSDIFHKVYLFTRLAEEISADGDFDVIHAHDWVTYPAGVEIKARTGKPLVLHVHALETDRVGDSTRNEIYALEKKAMDIADRIIAVSNYTKEKIVENYQVDPEKIAVIHNGIEPAEKFRQPHQLKDKLVLFLGRLTHQKGPHFLLETAEKVSRVYPRVKFVVAGTGDQFAPMLEMSAYKKLGRKFIFTGFLPKAKVNDLLSMADVYFMPSVSEPFGLTALEAAQAHVPGVISSQSGAAEVIKASLQADFWDTDKYANYIYALLRYNALHKEITERAIHNLTTLTWREAADKILALYTGLSTN